ncbi:hypothetical protein GOV06_05625 [Candidatus Woesearchaeota archaeon]|nr:hypothetical protein [Candidatus Woesearchaeota archaeon]
MDIEQIAQEWKQLKEKDEAYKSRIKDLERQKQDLEKQEQKTITNFFQSDFGALDNIVQKYLQEKGFERITSIGFSKDIFRTIKRDFAKNPTYVSKEGYLFHIDTNNRFKFLNSRTRYRLAHTKDIKDIAGIHRKFYYPKLLESFLTSTIIGATIFALGAYYYADLPPSDAFGVGLIGAVGGMVESTLCPMFRMALDKHETKTISFQTYESIEKLVELYKEK